jgi:hypothetical protein
MKQRDSACRLDEERKMERAEFVKLVEEALDALPTKFRKRIHNVAVLVGSVLKKIPPTSVHRVRLSHGRRIHRVLRPAHRRAHKSMSSPRILRG